MQNPRESPDAFARWVETRELWHRDFWLASSAHYRSIGLYQQMADFANIQSGERWLNLGCGFCDLEVTVLRNSKPLVISIDNNPYMLLEAKERLQQNGHLVNPAESNEVQIYGEQQSYFRSPKREPNFKIKDGQVNVFLDDIRNLSLKNILKGSIDVVTYSLSGISRAAVAQYPLKLDFEPGDYMNVLPEETNRIYQIALQVMTHVFRTAVQVLKPGGRLIYIDRFGLDTDPYSQISRLNIPKSLIKVRDTSTVIQESGERGTAVIFDGSGEPLKSSRGGFFEFRYQPRKQKQKKKRH